MAPAGFTAHSMQVMPWKHAAPRCPSTQAAAGVKSPCGRLLASERMLDHRVGAGRAGFVAQTSCQRCVSHSSCSRLFIGSNVRALQAAQPRAHNSAADEPASRHPLIRAVHSRIDAEQLASAAPSHWASADKHPRTPTIGSDGREAGAEGSMGRTGGWGGRKAGAEGSLGRNGGWGGREYGAEGSMGR